MPLFNELLVRLEDSLERLPDRPEEDPRSTLRALWFAAAGCPRSAEWAVEGALPSLDAQGQDTVRAFVARRLSGVPLCHVTRRQRFLDLEMYAGPGALIPRKETEIVGRAALALIDEAVGRRGSARVVDVCTGSGNLALAFAAHQPRAHVVAADLLEDAIAVAQENARIIGLAGKVDFRRGDLLEPFGADWNGTVDVLTCNPPYISTGKLSSMPGEIARHEPSAAFDGGPFGVRILKRVVTEGLRVTRPGGWLCLEVGRGQGPPMVHVIERLGAYSTIRTYADRSGDIRAVAAQISC